MFDKAKAYKNGAIFLGHTVYEHLPHTFATRSSAIAQWARDALCQSKSCQQCDTGIKI